MNDLYVLRSLYDTYINIVHIVNLIDLILGLDKTVLIDSCVWILDPKEVAVLEGVVLTEWLWLCWRKYDIVELGIEVSYAQDRPIVGVLFWLPAD